MPTLKDLLPPKLFDIIDRVDISKPKQIIVLSVWDIKKLTNLSNDDIILLKNIAADLVCPFSVTADKMIQEVYHSKLTTGCAAIDSFLKGGFRLGTLTEIYGESGSGKTQLGIQAVTHNWLNGCLYICTEDLFPVKRFEQIKQVIPNFNPNIDYGKNIFVEHVTEPHELLSCVRVRLPKLLNRMKLSLIVIDSIAAPFRSESTNYIQRAEELRELGIALVNIAQKYNLAVVCINQVRTLFDETDNVLPSLGLAWSNMIPTRLCIKKTAKIVQIQSLLLTCHVKTNVREISIIFAPDLPNSKVELVITSSGIQSV